MPNTKSFLVFAFENVEFKIFPFVITLIKFLGWEFYSWRCHLDVLQSSVFRFQEKNFLCFILARCSVSNVFEKHVRNFRGWEIYSWRCHLDVLQSSVFCFQVKTSFALYWPAAVTVMLSNNMSASNGAYFISTTTNQPGRSPLLNLRLQFFQFVEAIRAFISRTKPLYSPAWEIIFLTDNVFKFVLSRPSDSSNVW